MPWDDNLSGNAYDIASSEESPLRVMAGPGTGKTYALRRRVARLLEEGANPARLLVVTFTRVAAADLVDELRGMEIDGCDQINAGTLHSFCFRVLMRHDVLAHLNRVPRPLVYFRKAGAFQFEAASLLHDITCSQFGGRRDCTTRIEAFEACWARLQSDEPGWPQDQVDRNFHQEMEQWLHFHNAMLIGEVVPEVLRYLRNNAHSPELTAYDHVIVDEYQDLNRAEQVLIDLLASNSDNLIVGDEDQSIYSFRFAHPEGISQFQESHEKTIDFELLECRRCPQVVVSIADSLIRNNYAGTNEVRLRPLPTNPTGELHIVQWNSLQNEARGLAAYTHQLLGEGDYEPQDILIICPRRQVGIGIRDELQELDIEAHSFYHEEILDSVEAQEAASLLTLCADRNDRVALRFLLGSRSNSFLKNQYAAIRQYCEVEGAAPFDVLTGLRNGDITITRTRNIVQRFNEIVEMLSPLEGLTGDELVGAVFPDGEEWSSPIRVFLSTRDVSDISASGLLERIKAFITQPDVPHDVDYVRVMSLHKSKGLTSKVVLVATCVEGLIPYLDRNDTPAEHERNLREQRRLFYVAITRPREKILISSVWQIELATAYRIGARVQPGQGVTITSRFVSELGAAAPVSVSGEVWQENGFE